MASFYKNHPLNQPGPLFTDTSCIDCGTCFHLAPQLFEENISDDKSIVVRQPEDHQDWLDAKRAILSCPTNSIGLKQVTAGFKNIENPLPFEIVSKIFYLGFTSPVSYGASSYLIQLPDGNIMVDCPRFHPFLVRELKNLGGVKWIFLTHQDDVADHQKFQKQFGSQRIIHQADVNKDTSDCEIILEEEGVSFLPENLKIIMTPGHTKGHISLLFKDQFLFSGDHLFIDQKSAELKASKSVCWDSWERQITSMEKLLTEKFEWVLPGHGGWGHFKVEIVQHKLKTLIASMKGRLHERIYP